MRDLWEHTGSMHEIRTKRGGKIRFIESHFKGCSNFKPIFAPVFLKCSSASSTKCRMVLQSLWWNERNGDAAKVVNNVENVTSSKESESERGEGKQGLLLPVNKGHERSLPIPHDDGSDPFQWHHMSTAVNVRQTLQSCLWVVACLESVPGWVVVAIIEIHSSHEKWDLAKPQTPCEWTSHVHVR